MKNYLNKNGFSVTAFTVSIVGVLVVVFVIFYALGKDNEYFSGRGRALEKHTLTILVAGKGEELNHGKGTHVFEEGSVVNIAYKAHEGWSFSHYEGSCSRDVCQLTMNSNKNVVLTFNDDLSCSQSKSNNCYKLVNEDLIWIDDSGQWWTETLVTVEDGIQWGCQRDNMRITTNSDGNANTLNVTSWHNDEDNFSGSNYYNYKGSYVDIGCVFSNNGTVAAKVCADLEYAGERGWHLPSWSELRNEFAVSACSWGEQDSAGECDQCLECYLSWDKKNSPYYYWTSSLSNLLVDFSKGDVYSEKDTAKSALVRCKKTI